MCEMGDKAWKALERLIARDFGGKRNVRGSDFSESAPDVETELFVFECKQGMQVPLFFYKAMEQCESYLMPRELRHPVVVVRRKFKKPLVIMRYADFKEWHGVGGEREDTGDDDNGFDFSALSR